MAEGTESDTKKPMTDAERLELAQKLDQELDEFIDSLEKKRYSEGWPEDRWEEEMDKHPFFMKSNPEGGALSPLAEGLAKLKYDPEENTPLELATNYKEDGNFNFEHKNYRLAILGYTEGIKVKCDDPAINASLYSNRAAAHYQLKNFRSALLDCEKAITYDVNHAKARLRAAKSAFQIAKYDTCIEHCQNILDNQSKSKDVVNLQNKAKKKKASKERDARKQIFLGLKKHMEDALVIRAVRERGIRVANCKDEFDIKMKHLRSSLPGADCEVRLEGGILKWPVLFIYPEYKITDIVKDCPENVPVWTQLEQTFPAPWDENDEYKCSNVNLYIEGYDRMPHIIDLNLNLADVLVSEYFELSIGTPAFFIFPRGSLVERLFLRSYM